MMVFSICTLHVCKETVILFRMAVYEIIYMYTLIHTQEIISYEIYKSALRLVSEISYAMTLSVRLCLSLFMTEIAFKWVYSRIASPSRTATER